MKNYYLLICLTFSTAFAFAQKVIHSDDPHILYSGRITYHRDNAELSWTGNSVKINFTGTDVKVLLKDERGENYFKVVVDGQLQPDIHLDTLKHLYTLVAGLSPGRHTLELFKRTEWAFGKTWFYGFELDADTKILEKPAEHARKIEFYGNSITCGYAVLDTTGKDRGTAPYEDGYLSYAAITARHFDAEYSCIAKSGIGVLVSWFPLIMPEMYDRLDATDENSRWDFKKYTPQLVIVNLFQNDSWIVKQPQNAEFIHRFGTKAPSDEQIIAAYQNLVANIRKKYHNAQIICVLGNMDASAAGAPWPGYIAKAVANLNDNNIHVHIFPYKGTPGHPSKAEQQTMADDLIGYIEQNIKW